MSTLNIFCIRPKGFNIGNDVISLGMEHFIERAFGRVVNLIRLPATSKYETVARAGLTSKLIYEINQYGDAVIVGGGNLYENGELNVDTEALDALEVPLMLFSLSMGRVFNRHNQLVRRTDAMPARIAQAINQKAVISLTRDAATCEYLHGIGQTDAVIGGCPTIFLDRIVDRLPSVSEADQGNVLISVRNPELMNIPLPVKARVHHDVASVISFLRRKGCKSVRLLCHDHRDIPFAASFEDVDYIYTSDVHTFLALLRSASLCISFRLHSILPCLSLGTPVIPISYDERSLSLIDTVGFGSWQIDLVREGRLPELVADRFGRIEEQKAIRTRVDPLWASLYDTMSGAFEQLAELTGKAGTSAAARNPLKVHEAA